ncbi:hypothetical protein COU36_03115 [Candidatus Micrarchaeota archaeon CG10_big_fil_rev_8_21_14_0_10_59_7]|nr:MAG: hypothetical protein COU36_03115 [Candidatus Micrarchaeota archaeon CG10_big_fil_rev_8_21_14_0_10_59_7]
MDVTRRRGIFYSLMAMALLMPIAAFALYSAMHAQGEGAAVVTRIVGRETSNFAESVELDFPRALSIAGRTSLTAGVNHVVSSGDAADDAQLRLRELAWNATYYGEQSALMSNNSVSDWAERLQTKGLAYGLNVSATVTNVSVSPYDAFHVLFSANMSLKARSDSYSLNLTRTLYAQALVGIEGVEDPLYPLMTNGLVDRVILANATAVYGVEALDSFFAGRRYIPSRDGASFLDRLEGHPALSSRYSASRPAGLESLVDLSQLLAQGVPIEENSTVADYLYFDETTPAGFLVNGSAYGLLYLDTTSASIFGVGLVS